MKTRAIVNICLLAVILFFASGCSILHRPINNPPAPLPDTARVEVSEYRDGGAVVAIRGVWNILYVATYNGNKEVSYPTLTRINDKLTTFFLPNGQSFDFVFLAKDGEYHHVKKSGSLTWKDISILVDGSAMTAERFKR